MKLEELRAKYERDGLSEHEAGTDPTRLFDRWIQEARQSGLYIPGAMALATVDEHGAPANRAVILRHHDDLGLVFYTNYRSEKARQVDAGSRVAALVLWTELSRQVRVTGTIEKLSTEESDAYFEKRSRGAQIEAWASPQSEVIPDRRWLEERFRSVAEEYEDRTMPRPHHWGGYRILCERYEFWQGRPDRMHDRLLYTRSAGGGWDRVRLAP